MPARQPVPQRTRPGLRVRRGHARWTRGPRSRRRAWLVPREEGRRVRAGQGRKRQCREPCKDRRRQKAASTQTRRRDWRGSLCAYAARVQTIGATRALIHRFPPTRFRPWELLPPSGPWMQDPGNTPFLEQRPITIRPVAGPFFRAGRSDRALDFHAFARAADLEHVVAAS
jgi:hypothetical protein